MNLNFKKYLINFLIIVSALVQNPSVAKCINCYKSKVYSVNWAMCYKDFVMNNLQYRAVICNGLNLNKEQYKYFIQKVIDNLVFYDEKTDLLIFECNNLKNMKNKTLKNKIAQKKVIKQILNDIENQIRHENRELKKYLTRNQKSKYRLITKLEIKDAKKDCRQKDYIKLNPMLIPPFGNLK